MSFSISISMPLSEPRMFSSCRLPLSFVITHCTCERVGTAAGRLLITLSNNPAPPTVSSPRGSAPLLMETNSSSARGRGVSKHPLSSYERTLAVYRNPSKTQCEWDQKETVMYVQYVEVFQSGVQSEMLKYDKKGEKRDRVTIF